ncbi:hypothetical protein CDCA_CDCA13G3639 [Cyanidium caldarium]|uniref:Uncharacterized protein n=1 Tax=Cyanidium caldarium TaxID=2771 RepID=A0AAV9IZC3_CYACA|nr:hypothetical protein CDCA_CDCA13G3639 [Cyanidium caldarium]
MVKDALPELEARLDGLVQALEAFDEQARQRLLALDAQLEQVESHVERLEQRCCTVLQIEPDTLKESDSKTS